MRISEASNLLLLECNARRLAAASVQFYRSRLEAAIRIMGDKDIKEVSIHDLREVVAKSLPRSAWHNYRALRRLFAFLVSEEILKVDPSAKLAPPKMPKTSVEPLSEEQITLIFNEAKKQQGWCGLRDATIFATLIGTGLRRAELCNLREEDVRIDQGVLRVVGKGNKERFVPIPTKLRKLLAKYVALRASTRIYGKACEYFFRNNRGEYLNPHAVTRMMNRLGKRLGLKFWTHRARHTFATYFMDNPGADVVTLQAICGWSSLQMAQVYVKPTMRKMQESSEAFSPVNKL